MRPPSEATLPMLLKSFRLPTFVREHASVAADSLRQGLSHEQYLLALSRLEATARNQRRVEKLLVFSRLPREKSLGNFDLSRLPSKTAGTIAALRSGAFLDEAINVIVFGVPGTGKTHLVAGLGQELVRQGRSVLFAPTFSLVQRLLAAKRDLRLPAELRKLDRFDALILDDLGYVQQSREEMEVLFTLIAERYERRSILVTSNLVFSKWDQIFHDPMTTAAAVDRIVHHSIVLELSIKSYRAEQAQKRIRETGGKAGAE